MAVGITADSFIVYFERIRDEMRDGRSMRVAVETGWARARNTCLAADAVSLLAAVVLYIFAIGVVRGFAFALGHQHPDRRRGVLLLHQADGDLAGPVPVLLQRAQAVRAARRDARHRPAPEPHALARLEGVPDGQDVAGSGNALYEGDVSIDFVGRKWLWYTISGIIVLVAVAGLYFKGLNFGIEFEGGVEYTRRDAGR